MKPFITILIRVLAIFFLMSGVMLGLPVYLSAGSWEVFTNEDGFILATYVGVPAITGIGLWFFAPILSARVIGEDNTQQSFNEASLVRAGSFLIGVYWAVRSVSHLISQYSYDSVNYGEFVVLAISVFLILGSNIMAIFFIKLRTYGTNV